MKDSNILNIYRFGSHVYGTNNEKSDEDFIYVVNNYQITDSIDKHYYTKKEFQSLLNNHDIRILECYFLEHLC